MYVSILMPRLHYRISLNDKTQIFNIFYGRTSITRAGFYNSPFHRRHGSNICFIISTLIVSYFAWIEMRKFQFGVNGYIEGWRQALASAECVKYALAMKRYRRFRVGFSTVEMGKLRIVEGEKAAPTSRWIGRATEVMLYLRDMKKISALPIVTSYFDGIIRILAARAVDMRRKLCAFRRRAWQRREISYIW